MGLCVSVFPRIYASVYVCVHVPLSVWGCVFAQVCACAPLCMCVDVCVHVYIACTYLYAYAYVSVCLCVWVCCYSSLPDPKQTSLINFIKPHAPLRRVSLCWP